MATQPNAGNAGFSSLEGPAWTRWRARITPPYRVGIVPRLGVAFAAVSVLAIAANIILEHGVVEPDAAEAELAVASVTAPAIPATTPLPAVREVSAPTPADDLIPFIERYNLAVRNRATGNLPDAEDFRQKSAQELERALALALRTRLEGSTELVAHAKAYKALADTYIRLADDRRRQLQSYARVLDDMSACTKSAFDHSWKIFGRIVARQSLIDLDTHLTGLRRHFALIEASRGLDDSILNAAAANELAFAATLEKNSRSLLKSEGQTWLQRVQDNFFQLISLRADLLSINQQSIEEERALMREAGQLKSLARMRGRAQQPAAERIAPPRPGVAPLPVPVLQSAAVGARKDQGHLIAWLSAAVLLLLVFISMGTALSIVGPVKRMLRATARIAGGDTSVRVPRGGIKELDRLAVAFNRMAEQLALAQAIAREYQQQLEIRVDERTRQLQYLAEHDPLTLLPNRRQLFTLLNAAIEKAAQDGRYVGVFFLDLDNFKNINDGMGHAFGDGLLQGIAQRLRETAQGFGFAARLGGDEFTVVYESAAGAEAIQEAGAELVDAFHKPLSVEGRELIVSVSVGASYYPDHEQSADALLRAADAALFRAKALGRSQLTVFTPELLAAASAKFTTEQSLRRAIERNEFELVFQPEIGLRTLQTTVVEALLRWRLPDGRCVTPGDFLGVAEESGLIMEISDWVLRTAVETAARWHHGEWPAACVAVNVSSRQLLHGRFVERVDELLREFKLPPRCLEIELTETVLQTGPGTIEALERLRARGVSIALDDFGAGYSSLSSLELLPLSRVKLDRSLVASIHTSARSAAIAQAIINLCDNLQLAVTAEGVEKPEQLALLSRYRSICLQGYLLSRPVPRDSLLSTVQSMARQMQNLTAASSGVPEFKARSKVRRLF